MTYNNNNTNTFGTSLNNFVKFVSMFGGNGSGVGDSGLNVPLNQLRQAGQSEASSADANLALQQKYADQAANSNYNTALRSREQGSNIDTNAYQQKQATDTQAASDRLKNQLNIQAQAPGSSSFAGYSDGIYNYDPQISGSPYSPTISYNQRLSPQVALLREQNKLQQQDADNAAVRASAAADRDRYNQQILANSNYQNQLNLNADQYKNQRDLAQIDAQSRIQAAGIGGQSSIIGSLFGSFGNNNGNAGRYW